MGSGGRGPESKFESGPRYKESLLGGTAVASVAPPAYRLFPIIGAAVAVDIITVDSYRLSWSVNSSVNGLAGSSFSIPVGCGNKSRSSSIRWVYVSCYSPTSISHVFENWLIATLTTATWVE
ncbi:hypothetical protein HOY82DRAFT_410866 [Tuber indicum]|nr:hypothetical protein HOY82DRAFT_410866 [Tuber indicum]